MKATEARLFGFLRTAVRNRAAFGRQIRVTASQELRWRQR